MVNVQQVDKHYELFKISLAEGFLDPVLSKIHTP